MVKRIKTKKIKPNRYKGESRGRLGDRLKKLSTSKGFVIIPIIITLVSFSALYLHDFVTQSPFFAITRVDITGCQRISKEEILGRAQLDEHRNIFQINTRVMALQVASHPWVKDADVERTSLSSIKISVREQKALAIVAVRNIAKVLINSQGRPFKEYDPQKDKLENLPIISGIDLTQVGQGYIFDGPLFNSILDLIKEKPEISIARGDENLGVTIKTPDIYNNNPSNPQALMPIKLGFNQFGEKLRRAEQIAEYMNHHFPGKNICAMDLFTIEKVFIKTSATRALQATVEKGA
ncbi:MAG: FtsQ-type POTRA domain-containing protein [Desulfovibrionales bacterium]|nr:FtsQ-type POTRA domain-containing protein [Desulfovibrionales bacterium]